MIVSVSLTCVYLVALFIRLFVYVGKFHYAACKIERGGQSFPAARRKFFRHSVPIKLPVAGLRLKCPSFVTFHPDFR